MKSRSGKLYLLVIISALFIGAGLLIAASFVDLPLAKLIFDPDDYYGRIGAGYGQLPIFLSALSVGVFLFIARDRKKMWLQILEIVAGAGLVGFATYSFAANPLKYRTNFVMAFTIPFGIVLAIAFVALEYHFFKNVPAKRILWVCLALALAALAELGVWFILKSIWGRTRPYLLFEVGDSTFVNWWNFRAGFSIKATLSPDDLKIPSEFNDYFCSFPSGHTSNATLMVFLLPALGELRDDTRKYRPYLASTGIVWALLVAFSRLRIGAHYLSDVSMAFILTVSSGFIVYFYFFLYKDKEKVADEATLVSD